MVAVSHPVIWTIVSSHGKAKVNTTQFESSRSTFSLPGQPLMQHTFDRSRPLHILSHAQLHYIIIVYTRRDAPSRHHYNEIAGRTECAYASSVNNNTNRQPLGDNLRVHLSNIWPILTITFSTDFGNISRQKKGTIGKYRWFPVDWPLYGRSSIAKKLFAEPLHFGFFLIFWLNSHKMSINYTKMGLSLPDFVLATYM